MSGTLIDLIREGHFKRGQRVVFLHTGGSFALSGYTHTLFSSIPSLIG